MDFSRRSKDKLTGVSVSLTENFITEEVQADATAFTLPELNAEANKVLIMPDLNWMMVSGTDNKLTVVKLRGNNSTVTQLLDTTAGNITSFEWLLGGNSLLISDDKGVTSQWFLVRNENNEWLMTKIREFSDGSAAIDRIAIEHRRKGFVTITDEGDLSFYSTTAHRNSLSKAVAQGNTDMIALSPRSNALLVEQSGEYTLWKVHNEHPEISWSALWEKVWYEGYQEPEFTWQSSASTNDFEPNIA